MKVLMMVLIPKVLQVQKLGLIVGYTIIQSLFGKESACRGNLSFHLLVGN